MEEQEELEELESTRKQNLKNLTMTKPLQAQKTVTNIENLFPARNPCMGDRHPRGWKEGLLVITNVETEKNITNIFNCLSHSPQICKEEYTLDDILHNVTRDDLKCVRLRYTIPGHIIQYCTILYSRLYYAIAYYIMLHYYTILYSRLYYNITYYIMQYYTILYSRLYQTIECYIMQYYTIAYYFIQYYIPLYTYYTILCVCVFMGQGRRAV